MTRIATMLREREDLFERFDALSEDKQERYLRLNSEILSATPENISDLRRQLETFRDWFNDQLVLFDKDPPKQETMIAELWAMREDFREFKNMGLVEEYDLMIIRQCAVCIDDMRAQLAAFIARFNDQLRRLEGLVEEAPARRRRAMTKTPVHPSGQPVLGRSKDVV